jgi:hypothetical protein
MDDLTCLGCSKAFPTQKASVTMRLGVTLAKALMLMSINSSATLRSKGIGKRRGNMLMTSPPHHKATEI